MKIQQPFHKIHELLDGATFDQILSVEWLMHSNLPEEFGDFSLEDKKRLND